MKSPLFPLSQILRKEEYCRCGAVPDRSGEGRYPGRRERFPSAAGPAKANPAQYLRPTLHCDPTETAIVTLAEAFRAQSASDWEYAEAIFDFVRNDIWFAPSVPPPANVTATLRNGFGICVDKGNVLAALARAGGVPARYVMLESHGIGVGLQDDSPQGMFPFMRALGFDSGSLKKRFNRLAGRGAQAGNRAEPTKPRPHFYVELQVNGFWIACDPTLGDADAAGADLPIPKFGYDPFMLWGAASGNVIGHVEELPRTRDRWLTRRLFCSVVCREGKCANQVIRQLRQRGEQVLAAEGRDAYRRRMTRFYVPLPGFGGE